MNVHYQTSAEDMLVTGIMAGSSLDGIDFATCRFSTLDSSFTLLAATTYPIPALWQARILELRTGSARLLAETNVAFGHFLAALCHRWFEESQIVPDLIGCHGITIFHDTTESRFTFQLGDGETMSAHLPCPVITQFRSKDIALGGQGAPLVPLAEKVLFPNFRRFLNLGGICNLTSFSDSTAIAFDIAPCNQVLNELARRVQKNLTMDENGTMARSGTIIQPLLEKLNALSYFHQPPPKSLDREWIQQEYCPLLKGNPFDLLRTVTEQIAQQIAYATNGSPEPVLATGGGCFNSFLLERIEAKLAEQNTELFLPSTELIQFKEAIAFAWLGLQVWTGKTTTLPDCTGASKPVIGGSIHLPS
ncbi:MAG: anhydro-N-acetylmuramic acid kinase [Bacteroidia bacterium]|nr:anhydro-N-acetylmuramic acid kinase [Bacteroidia bacterium]